MKPSPTLFIMQYRGNHTGEIYTDKYANNLKRLPVFIETMNKERANLTLIAIFKIKLKAA